MDALLYYGLEYNPFTQEKNILIQTTDYKEMSVRLSYLQEVKGIGLFTANPGIGKTYTLKQFTNSLNRSLYKICYCSMSTLTTMDFYRSLAYALDLEPSHKKIDMFRQIQGRIESLATTQKITPVIILDEAQYLKNEILHDLTLLLNFHMDSVRNCIVILCGLPNLSVTLSRTTQEALRQRIVTQYQMIGLEPNEYPMYIEAKLKAAGRTLPLVDKAAIEAIISNTQGSIRKLNTLLTNCLLLGEKQGKDTIDVNLVFDAVHEQTI